MITNKVRNKVTKRSGQNNTALADTKVR